ncbi:MAG: hypothetical protein LBL96_10350 [Clostridiales bacterium]|jgi:ATP-dependent DNA helicase RecG|nr:hypothetical protein [Clostridiales bacterium]
MPSYDLTPVYGAKLTDLSRAVFEDEYLPSAFAADVLAENGRSYEERLASCRMIVSPDDPTPTMSAVFRYDSTIKKAAGGFPQPNFVPYYNQLTS